MKTELLLLAAGQSKRFGGIKQLAEIHGQPMICHCLAQYRQADKWLDEIDAGHVVLGSNAELIGAVLPESVGKFVANTWQQGMGHSLAEGMNVIASETSHVLIALADQILITQQIIKQMLRNSAIYPNHIVAAKYAGGVGAPCIFPKKYFSQLKELDGDKGARTLLQQYPQQLIGLEMPEASFDIDTTDDLRLM